MRISNTQNHNVLCTHPHINILQQENSTGDKECGYLINNLNICCNLHTNLNSEYIMLKNEKQYCNMLYNIGKSKFFLENTQ